MSHSDLEKGSAGNGTSDVTRKHRLTTWLQQDINRRHSDLVLLVCSFISGLCDSGAFNAWSCFICMQTGNTIFLGLGAAGLPATKPYGWLRSLIAIVTFLIGCFLFSRMRKYKSRSRGVLSLSFVLQAICLTVAAVLVQTKVVPEVTEGSGSMKVLVPIVFLGLQAGGQVWTSEVLGFKEIPTTVLTSVYFGLAADAKFMQALTSNAPRNRRIGAVCALLLGSICGGWLSKSQAGIPVVFFVAAGLKYVISAAWVCWPAELS